MQKKFFIALLLLLFTFSLVSARGGGGCFLPGTLVKTISGEAPIESLKIGDTVLSFDGAELVPSKIVSLYEIEAEQYFEIKTEGTSFSVTGEHLIAVGFGTFKQAKDLSNSDSVLIIKNGSVVEEKIISISVHNSSTKAYNLLVDKENTFFANGILAHNKGCFLPDTNILLSNGGKKQISQIIVGDEVKAFDYSGNVLDSRVNEIYSVDVNEYYILTTTNFETKVTGEHPVYVGGGEFKVVDSLNVGDKIFVFDGEKLLQDTIVSKEKIVAPVTVYNLRTDWPNTYFANFVAVHNKGGGCFLPDTKVILSSGAEKKISELSIGERVKSFGLNGEITNSVVENIYSLEANEYYLVKTNSFEAKVTSEHPFYVGSGLFKPVKELAIGEEVIVFNGGKMVKEKVLQIQKVSATVTVYNLSVSSPNTFFANNFAVHNKGGGSSGGGSGGSGDPFITLLVFGVFVGLYIILFLLRKFHIIKEDSSGDLDYLYPHKDIESKALMTGAIINYLKNSNKYWDKKVLVDTAKSTFVKLQECWQARDYTLMQPLMMTDLYNQHLAQIAGMVKDHEIDMIENLDVKLVEVVNVRAAAKESQNEFTVLIEASALDYYIDDKTKDFLRGDTTPSTFQEFWVFQRSGGKWLLREINQTRESNALREDNFVEELTSEQMKGMYAQVSKTTDAVVGEDPSWMSAGLTEKSNKIYRMLNFLSSTDKSWDESFIKEEARKIFTAVYMGLEDLDVSGAKGMVFDSELEEFQKKVDEFEKNKTSIEYRNFCVRKVDIVLVNNFNDNNKDEFVARIAAHAQKIVKKSGKIISSDEYVTPFEEYWTFQKQAGQWMLKEAHPSKSPKDFINQENYDEESSKDQLKWYYTKERA